mgnify:CR=1 FL=1
MSAIVPCARQQTSDGSVQSSWIAMLPADTILWSFYAVREKLDTSDVEHHRPARAIWHDIVLTIAGDRVPVLSPKHVEIYAVRADKSTVCHRSVSAETPEMFHRASSVFHLLGPGNTLRLRLFTNARNEPCSWPVEHRGVPRIPGMVLVVAQEECAVEGQLPSLTRHVFFCPLTLDALWAPPRRKHSVSQLPSSVNRRRNAKRRC